MSRASRARAIASAAAVGGAGLVGAGGAIYGVLLGQSRLARHRIGEPLTTPPAADGTYGSGGDPITLVVFGDSGAAGFGVDRAEDTTAAVAAAGLAAQLGRQVQLRCVAAVGAQSADLQLQIDAVDPHWPELAVIAVGANDVTHRIPPGRSVALLTAAIERLHKHDVAVVVATCPDLGTIRPIPHPLRWVARRWSRSLAAAQTVASVSAGARSVSVADLLGPEFAAHPDTMFGPDQFHPSVTGYQAFGQAIVPSLADAVTAPAQPHKNAANLDLAQAAVRAAEVAGAEVSGARGSRVRGLLRLRRSASPATSDR
ncbi:MAG: SGNH/GDSL hydrolase family protein [Actinomycetes bacterium]